MSTKKDRFNQADKNYMNIALRLAMLKHGLTGTNPAVGCVIVKNNKIISIGSTGLNGKPHAERSADLSACGFPFNPVDPIDIILLFFTITQPTAGFVPVNPCFNIANLRAMFI